MYSNEPTPFTSMSPDQTGLSPHAFYPIYEPIQMQQKVQPKPKERSPAGWFLLVSQCGGAFFSSQFITYCIIAWPNTFLAFGLLTLGIALMVACVYLVQSAGNERVKYILLAASVASGVIVGGKDVVKALWAGSSLNSVLFLLVCGIAITAVVVAIQRGRE